MKRITDHLILILAVLFLAVPVLTIFLSSTHDSLDIARNGLQFTWGGEFLETYGRVLTRNSGFTGEVTAWTMMVNSAVLGFGFAIGKIVVSMLAAYAIVFFRIPFASLAFWIIFLTLLLPVEVRIIPSYEVTAELGLLNSYSGLIVPLIASATGTFFFRQFFMSVPDELLEAARIDGAGPWRFFVDILVPLSKTMIAALFIIMFVYGWTQYLWPVLVVTDERYFNLVMGIKQTFEVIREGRIPPWSDAFALAILAMVPPVLVILFFQRWFVQGLTGEDK